ncbi:MAG TPA: 3-oxoacyl-ACP reductase [Rhodopirellula baltica]|uniref:Short chain dehydrogenase n=1 Tax=Rhodopirellula baltica (strain DSM 10527 / NCIMB 13988 / SH1) TaxID=243090 RepID=Q7UGA1_RHOBA|nr:SDR family oxidoreductase [Rhodopirellula baltica]CAD78428.1 putative short chain dehydrogenase [Rhodopirellula baltica SH 1]HBE62036.1 3-oxoacyl-ACP reductase [Rhodopirellula baltica]
MNNNNRVAIVTGGSRGIGAAIAERLASDGFSVVINYANSSKAADELTQRITEAGGSAQSFQADVSDSDAVEKLFDFATESFGGVDVLVNNAGVLKMQPLAETSDEDFARLVDVNLKGCFHTMREAACRLRDGGRVINLSSSVIGLRMPNYGVYSATKAAVEAMSSVLANELRGRQITVNSVAPGPTATKLFLDDKSDELIDRLTNMSPLERLGQPDDIASVVSFLAGPDGSWVNGQTLRANGGVV